MSAWSQRFSFATVKRCTSLSCFSTTSMSPAYDEASWRENRVRPGRMLDLFDDGVADMPNLKNTQSTKYQVIWLDSGNLVFNHLTTIS